MSTLLRPYDFEFFRNGVIVATIAGALCGLIGVFVVLKGMSYIGHGLSHAIFGGYAASALLGVNFILGAGTWGIASALMIGGVTRRKLIGADAAIGVITTASPGAMSRTRAKPRMSSATDSEATAYSGPAAVSRLPSTSGRIPCGSRKATRPRPSTMPTMA